MLTPFSAGRAGVFEVIPVGVAVPVFDLALALGGVGVFLLQILQIAVILFHLCLTVEKNGMATEVVVERQSLAVVTGQMIGIEGIASGVVELQLIDEVVEAAVNKEAAEDVVTDK